MLCVSGVYNEYVFFNYFCLFVCCCFFGLALEYDSYKVHDCTSSVISLYYCTFH